jgi:hypothetical protein
MPIVLHPSATNEGESVRLKPLFLVSALQRDLSIFAHKLGGYKGGVVD